MVLLHYSWISHWCYSCSAFEAAFWADLWESHVAMSDAVGLNMDIDEILTNIMFMMKTYHEINHVDEIWIILLIMTINLCMLG